jgi:hypothetical protein
MCPSDLLHSSAPPLLTATLKSALILPPPPNCAQLANPLSVPRTPASRHRIPWHVHSPSCEKDNSTPVLYANKRYTTCMSSTRTVALTVDAVNELQVIKHYWGGEDKGGSARQIGSVAKEKGQQQAQFNQATHS